VVFTYDVIWKESQVEWAIRWDVYMSNNHPVANSVATLVQYYQLVVDCNTNHLYGGHDFVRTLNKDISRYNRKRHDR